LPHEAGVSAARPAGPAWRIAFISFVVLSLELAFIRQIPAEVKAISYFTNLVLMASFFGLGLGCILQERRSFAWLLPLGAGLVWLFVDQGRGIVVYEAARSVHFWLPRGEAAGQARSLELLPAALAAFLAAAVPFVALGQSLARAMQPHPRLVAYGWDIAGSLLGTGLFSLAAFAGVPPWAWVCGLLLGWAVVMPAGRTLRAVTALCGVLFVSFAESPLEWSWSPYYFVQYRSLPAGLNVFVNSSFHQFAVDFRSTDPEAARVQAVMLQKWGRPYEIYRALHGGQAPARVLVLGAGTGNDVAVALREGAREVVAVEIDPVILRLGQTRNPSRPYADPRVRPVLDDARHFLRTTAQRFDLIVFGTLDSQALLSGHANLRLENYVYTREALADARRALVERGIVALHYSVFKEWLFGRLYSTVRSVFGDETLLFLESTNFLFNATIVAGKQLPELSDHPNNIARFGGRLISTDDWPFLYLERPTIAPLYLQLIGFVAALVLAAFLLVRRLHPVQGLYAHYLLLGLGFTLMESSAVVRLALLFGSTWVVNAVVFSSVLATIFLANLLVLRARAPRLELCWTALLAAVLINYAFPISWLSGLDGPARALAAGLLVGAPVLAAALCFSHLFGAEPVTGYPLGVNLVGAMAGGLVEYASMAVGMRAVWLLVFCVYALAWLTSRHARGAAAPPVAA